jgi:hypothetical protein
MRVTFMPALIVPALIALLAATASRAQAPLDVGVEVTNASDTAVVKVFAKPDGLPSWGTLAGGDIAAHAKKLVRIPSETNCHYVLRFVFTGGRTEEHQVDICKHAVLQVGSTR